MLCPNCHSQTENYCGQTNKAPKYFCEICGKEKKTKASRYCPECAAKLKRKVIRPEKEELIGMFRKLHSFSSVGEVYKVSDNTIRKWCKQLDLPENKQDWKDYLN